MNTEATTAPSATEVPAGPASFGGGLIQAILNKDIPSIVENPLVGTPAVNAQATASSADSNGASATDATEGHVSNAPVGPARRVTRATTSSAPDAFAATPTAARAPARPKRTRTITAITEPPAESALSAGVAYGLHERVSALQDDAESLASHLRDTRQRIDDLSQDATTRLVSLSDSVATLLEHQNGMKQFRVDMMDDIRNFLGEIREGQVLTAARLRALEGEDTAPGYLPAKRPRLDDSLPPPAVLGGPATAPAVSTTPHAAPTPQATATAAAVISHTTTPAYGAVVGLPVVPGIPSAMHPAEVQGPATPSATAPAMPTVAPLTAMGPFGGAAPTPVSVPTSSFSTAFSAPRNARRNYHVRFGPISTGGAAPIAVVQALLNMIPNGSVLAKLVKEAQLFPTDFTYIVATTFSYDHATGITQAWNTTRPEAYASVSAEYLRGN